MRFIHCDKCYEPIDTYAHDGKICEDCMKEVEEE